MSARIHESGCEPYLVRYIRPQKRNRSMVLVVPGTPGDGPPKCPKTKKVYINMLQPLNYVLLYASVTTILDVFRADGIRQLEWRWQRVEWEQRGFQ